MFQPILNHRQWDEDFQLVPEFGTYNGPQGPLAVSLVCDDGESFTTVTVNLPGQSEFLDDGVVFIKDYAENEQVVQTMLEAGWLAPTMHEVKSGFVMIPAMRLIGALKSSYTAYKKEQES